MRPAIRVTTTRVSVALFSLVAALLVWAPTHATPDTVAARDGVCPISAWPVQATDVPWLSSAYQNAPTHSPSELALEVLNCEETLHPASELSAELALISLNQTTNANFQNQNMLLNGPIGKLKPQYDFYNLGIPTLTLEDGPGGIIYRNHKGQPQPTTYPNELALAASMDPQLARLYGQQLGAEASALHFTGVQAPDLNLDRIPNWGRIQETYGEDPLLTGLMGSAETEGILQNDHVVVLKHFGVYGQETNRKSTNQIVSTGALYDTYLRPFAMTMNAVANDPILTSPHALAVMCSYGDLNGTRSCTSPTLAGALASWPYSGLVRSDLDTVTTANALLRSGVTMIKPLDVTQFQPLSGVATDVKAEIDAAALTVLRTMFSAGLVNVAQWKSGRSVGRITTDIAHSATTLSNLIEERGAVLLKNAGTGIGTLPVVKADGPVVIVAPMSLSTTCTKLAASLKAATQATVTCSVWNRKPVPATTLWRGLRRGTYAKPQHATTTWTAPTTGAYLINNTTFGYSSLKMDGTTIQNQPGITQFYGPNYTTIQVTKGQTHTFALSWSSVGPTVTISPIAPSIAAATSAVSGAKMAIVMANDWAAEGMDRDQIALPFAQDSIISAIAAHVPTSVALVTSGPVTMPWLKSVKSVMELWNPIGKPPVDNVVNNYVPAYSALFDGQVSPSGHLPVTFPTTQSLSPMNVTSGSNHFAYWPGASNVADLTLAPLNGTTIGYGWYQSVGWPVLFPFGFGLSYSSTASTFNLANGCSTSSSSSSLCLALDVRLTHDTGVPARASAQIYVAQPSSTISPRPRLVLGAIASVVCRDGNGLTQLCAKGNVVNTSISSLGVGAWSSAANDYRFIAGCYSFVVAPNSADAYGALANPSSAPGTVVHAVAPFSNKTTISAGACP